jgi:predicted ester cyclase
MSVFTNPASRAPGNAAAYVAAVLDLLGQRDPNDVLRRTPTVLPPAIDGLTAEQLRQPERPGKWSIVQVLQHLADSDVVWAWRMRLILAQDRPNLTGYDQDLWAERLDYASADPYEAVELFTVLRRANVKLLDRVRPADLRRVGIHVERGEESLDHLRRLYAGHDLLHLRQIDRIREAVAPASPEQIARRFYDLFNRREFDTAELLVSPQAVFHYPHTKEHLIGRAGYRDLAGSWIKAFPDGQVTVVELYRTDDNIIAKLLGRGTHTGPLTFGGPLTLPPTGRGADLRFTDTLVIREGLIVESNLEFDVQGLLNMLKG